MRISVPFSNQYAAMAGMLQGGNQAQERMARQNLAQQELNQRAASEAARLKLEERALGIKEKQGNEGLEFDKFKFDQSWRQQGTLAEQADKRRAAEAVLARVGALESIDRSGEVQAKLNDQAGDRDIERDRAKFGHDREMVGAHGEEARKTAGYSAGLSETAAELAAERAARLQGELERDRNNMANVRLINEMGERDRVRKEEASVNKTNSDRDYELRKKVAEANIAAASRAFGLDQKEYIQRRAEVIRKRADSIFENAQAGSGMTWSKAYYEALKTVEDEENIAAYEK